MEKIEWTPELEIGIAVIDGQHRRIVDYINALHDIGSGTDSAVVENVIRDLVDYTYSHFAFEEALMEEAGYEYLSVHQNTHRAFRDRVDHLHKQFQAGEDIVPALRELLQTWLLGHIVEDDSSYAAVVRKQLPSVERHQQGNWLQAALQRFFG